MRKLWLILSLWALPLLASTPPYSTDINTASNNLAATYSTSYPQLALSGMAFTNHLTLVNNTGTGICCDTETYSASSAPAVGNGHELCIPATWSQSYDFLTTNGNIYCRSQSGTISSGILSVQSW